VLQYDMSYSPPIVRPGRQPPDGTSLRLEDSPGITMTFLPLSGWPENSLEPVESQTRMITVRPTSSAVTAVAELLREARMGVIQDEAQMLGRTTGRGAAVPLSRETLQGVLLAGVGATFRTVEKPVVDTGAIRKLEIQVQRVPDPQAQGKEPSPADLSLEISLVATGVRKEAALPGADNGVSSGKEPQPSGPPPADLLTTETIVLRPQSLREQDRLAILLPSPFAVGGSLRRRP